MIKEDLEQFKKQLIDLRRLLLKPASIIGSTTEGDVCDISSMDRERNMSLQMIERDRNKLKAVEDALERIEDGSFGSCDECGETISFGRLKIMPFANVCVSCQSLQEKQARNQIGQSEPPLETDLTRYSLDTEE